MAQSATLQRQAETRARQPADRRTMRLVEQGADLLRRHSITALRVSLGVVFLAFGALKFFPGASPAAPLVERTIDTLTFGVITGTSAVVLTAVVECFIGITLITGKLLRPGLAVFAGALVGIMSPLVLFLPDMFPHGTPTLEAQYVFKDIVLAAAGLVVAVSTTRAKRRP
jgi:uncharacterized membrane protein YkgB